MSKTVGVFIVLAIYMIGVFLIGLLTGRKTEKGAEDYYTGKRSFGAIPTAFSAGATESSSWMFLGCVGYAYACGIESLWMLPGLIVGYWVNWYVTGPRLRKQAKQNGAKDLPEFLYKATDSKAVYIFGALIICLLFVPYMASNLLGAGKTVDAILNINVGAATIFSAIFVVAYCFIGGYRSVIWTDCCQASVMVLVFVFMPIYLLSQVGGWKEMWYILYQTDPLMLGATYGTTGKAAMSTIVGLVFYGFACPGQPHVVQRFISAKDNKTVKQGSVIATFWCATIMIGCCIMGFCARIILPNLADAEYALPSLMFQTMPAVVTGIVVGAIFAAIQSTFSSLLMVAVQNVASDIPSALGKSFSHEQETKYGRIAMVVLAVIAAGLAMLNFDSIFAMVWFAYSGLGAVFAPPLIMAVLKPGFMSKKGCLISMIAGGVTVCIWYFAGLTVYMFEALPGLAVSFLCLYVFSKLLPDKKEDMPVSA